MCGLALALACNHCIHRAQRLRGGGIKCLYVCACQKKEETEKFKEQRFTSKGTGDGDAKAVGGRLVT